MRSPLKRVHLMLDHCLVERLRREAREHHVSMPEMTRTLLDRGLGRARQPAQILDDLRRLRDSFGSMPDSAEVVRKDRDRGMATRSLTIGSPPRDGGPAC